MPALTVLHGHALDVLRGMADNSVHMVVTSPPYYGLRKYGDEEVQVIWGDPSHYGPPHHPAKARNHTLLLKMRAARNGFVKGMSTDPIICAYGLEPALELYITHTVQIFREVRRVLRKDGTLWLNIGDTSISDGGHRDTTCSNRKGKYNLSNRPATRREFRTRGNAMLRPKDCCLVPYRVVIALQEDGWYVRSPIVWHKPNPMPESVDDRPTKSHEYIYLLTKEADYFYDAEAIKEPSSENSHPRGSSVNPKACGPNSRIHKSRGPRGDAQKPNSLWRTKQNASFSAAITELVPNRNKRDVWTMAVEGYKGNHFATFPRELPRLCILAGTSAKGCCPKCGAPWLRIVKATKQPHNGAYAGKYAQRNAWTRGNGIHAGIKAARENSQYHDNPFPPKETIGWKPSCKCGLEDTVPCTVLDPFGGSGTTGEVALELARNATLIEISPSYHEQIHQRIRNSTPGLQLW